MSKRVWRSCVSEAQAVVFTVRDLLDLNTSLRNMYRQRQLYFSTLVFVGASVFL